MSAPRKEAGGRRVETEQVEERVMLGRYNPLQVTPEKGEVVELQLDNTGKLLVSQTNIADYTDTQNFFDGAYTYALDYDSNGNIIYAGKAAIGSSKTNAVWQIRKFTYDSSNNLTDIQWATGTQNYTNIWNNRTSLSYS